MPTPTKGPRLGGSPQHQRLLLSNLATALFEHGRITTTHAKAKALRPVAERLITFAKRGDLHARRQVLTVVKRKEIVHTLFAEIGPRFAERPGGYTRITKIGPRKGDNAPMAVIELVESQTVAQQAVGEAERARGTRFARRKGAAGGGAAEPTGAEAVAAATSEDAGEAPATEGVAATDETAGTDAGTDAGGDTGEVGGDAAEATGADGAAEGGEEFDDSGAGNQAESASETSQAEGEAEPAAEKREGDDA